MRKTLLLLIVVCASQSLLMAQEAGNRAYGDTNRRRSDVSLGNLYTTEAKDAVPSPFIEAYVMMNVKADEYIAVFGLAQQGVTPLESSRKLDAQVKEFTSALAGLGVKSGDIYVDFITQNRIYEFVGTGNTAREKLSGFETKKTVGIRYADRNLLEQMLAAAAKASIFDLIKVDYLVSDIPGVRSKLFAEAVKIIKQKEDTYSRLLNIKLRTGAIFQEKYVTFFPSELYRSYTAYESGAASDYARTLEKRKSTTFYFDPLEPSDFDLILNPAGVEPIVQCTLYLKVKYVAIP